ncbi:MAG TPA: excinuclease ABC subunit UvrB, partial [Fervidobacterium sp.]|nr:excinuclease ABC subunit UvrB [Fervidobacterium sp.]
IARMRMKAIQSIMTRRDTIVVASVSAIYACGDPRDFDELNIKLEVGQRVRLNEILKRLVKIGYEHKEDVGMTGSFRLRGDTLEIFPTYQDEGIRIELFGDEVDRIYTFDRMNRNTLEKLDKITIYPTKEYVTTEEKVAKAVKTIREELDQRIEELKRQGRELEAQRLYQRTMGDIELLSTLGYCSGIENYSRHFDGRRPGEAPYSLLDYYDDDFIVFLDESHITIPQLRAMYHGEMSRKKSLIEYGFRLPCAYDNRPLKFEEFLRKVNQTIFVSATPGPFEFEVSEQIVEQIIRPTGLIDPQVEVRPTRYQVDDLVKEITEIKKRGEKALVTVLTKKTAEMLAEYLVELNIKALYLHSELDSIKRVEVLKKLRAGEIDVVVGINLLREGLDLPEVSLVAILDADSEGFLRSETTLIQIIGRTARNENGKVIMYADRITPAMQKAIDETNRRRKVQIEYNKANNIKPQTIVKPLMGDIFEPFKDKDKEEELYKIYEDSVFTLKESLSTEEYIALLEEEMYKAASELRYEDAAKMRDELFKLKQQSQST